MPKVKRLARPVRTATVLTRHVTTITGGEARWSSRYRTWNRHADVARNLREAITFAVQYTTKNKIGTIVYIVGAGYSTLIPVYQAKWGHDGRLFKSWKPGPVPAYWRRIITAK